MDPDHAGLCEALFVDRLRELTDGKTPRCRFDARRVLVGKLRRRHRQPY